MIKLCSTSNNPGIKKCHNQRSLRLASTVITVTWSMANQGLRVLAFATKEVATKRSLNRHDIARGLVFLGLQGIIDPPRDQAIAAVKACQYAGIQVKMITGDHALTAAAIARQMGICSTEAQVFTGRQLAQMDEKEFSQAAQQGMVFARVAPEQKLHLVKALQSQGEIVAMTGDGVNDAPALKQADIGVAMGIAGAEVAKESADMLLTDHTFNIYPSSHLYGCRFASGVYSSHLAAFRSAQLGI